MAPASHPRIPALDGLRGLAVAGVLFFHGGFGWAQGGFLGVSLFFTLSGFLITNLLVAEWSSDGSISLKTFWSRRFRRLMPAAVACLLLVVVFGAAAATDGQLGELRLDVVAALAYVANWRFVLDGASYADLGQAPSPVQHFWSLAIEEQFYVLFPLVVVAARRHLRLVLAAGIVLSVAALLVTDDQLRAYYGTDARAAELLVGALLAVVVRPATSTASRRTTAAGATALALLLLSWAVVSQDDGRLYGGGLAVHAVLVAVVITAARSAGPLASALSLRPLRRLGRISYGAYLYHWPLFLWLTPQRTGLDGPILAAVRLGATLALAELSFRLLEEPIRTGRRLRPNVARVSLAAGAVAVVLAAVVVTPRPADPGLTLELAAGEGGLVAPATTSTTAIPTSSTSTTTAPTTAAAEPTTIPWLPGERLRVYVAGDSNAFGLGVALAKWSAGRGIEIWTSGWMACSLVPGGAYRYAGESKPTADKCDRWAETRQQELAEIRPHVTLLVYGSFDVLDRRLAGSDDWQHIGQPAYDARLRREIERLTDMATAAGSRVLWATAGALRTGTVDGVPPARTFPEHDPARIERLNGMIRRVVESRPGAGVLEVRRQMQTWPGGELDPERRPDGLHPSTAMLRELAAWAGPLLVERARRP